MRSLCKILLCVAVAGIFFSCTPQKRLERLVKHHPELLKADTITLRDSFPYPQLKLDTVLKPVAVFPGNAEEARALIKKIQSFYGDSIVVDNGEIRTVVIFKNDGSIGISSATKPPIKPVVKIVRVPLVKYQVMKTEIPWEWYLVAALIGVVVGFVISMKIKK